MITTEEGSFVVMGDYKLCDYKKTKADVLEHMHTWDFQVCLMQAVIMSWERYKDSLFPEPENIEEYKKLNND